MLKRFVLILICLTLSTSTFIACDSDTANNTATKETLVGSWSCKYEEETLALVLDTDGKGSVILTPRRGSTVVNIQYETNGNELILNTGDKSIICTYKIDDGYLLLKEKGSTKTSYKFTKNR